MSADTDLAMAAIEDGDGCCALLDAFLGAKLEVTEDGDGCCVEIELEALEQTRRSLGAEAAPRTALEIARDYIARGWTPVPVPHKQKKPVDENWQHLRITAENAASYFNCADQNVGVQLGEASNGLADVDLDSAEAVAVAGYFLPRTQCFGRASKPRSHWLFQSDLWQTEDKAAIQFKFSTGKGKDRKDQMILELRIGGGGKGAQTVFPGSTHECGELIQWDEQSPITKAAGVDLKQCCARAASSALLAAHFPSKGARHDAGLTLGGFMFRCGFNRPDTQVFVEAVTIASGQGHEKAKDVRKAAGDAWDTAEKGSNARGLPMLKETFGEDVAKKCAEWLGFKGERSEGKAKASVDASASYTGETWTELGNSHRLVQRHGQNIRFVHGSDKWLLWSGSFWRADEDAQIMRYAEETIEALFADANLIADETLRQAFRKFALKCQSSAQIRAMVQLAQYAANTAITPKVLDTDPMLLGVLNGTLDLKTGKFRPAKREDYVTEQANVAFDREAQCPNWLAFQHKICSGDVALVSYKQRVFGLFLTGLMVEILFIFHGAGSNGKTTELETISGILGSYAHSADAQIFLQKDKTGPTPEIVAVKGKRAVFINETAESDKLSESRVKYLCGNDTMSGRNLHEGIINFQPTHKMVLRTNHKPKIRGTDLGIWRRIHYVPYLVTISDDEKIENFRHEKLGPEWPGILNWMLDGLRDYLANGLRPPPIVSKATKEYRSEMDTVGQWITAMCERSLMYANLSLKTLFASYQKWAEDEIGWAVSRAKFAEGLRDRGFESKVSHGVTVFINIRLKDDDAAPV